MQETVQQYVDWIVGNRDLVQRSSLLLVTRRVMEKFEENPQDELLLPDGITEQNPCKILDLSDLISSLSESHTKLLNSAQELPTGEIKGNFFYILCDGLDQLMGSFIGYASRLNANYQRFVEELPEGLRNRDYLFLTLSVAYAHNLLRDIDPRKKKMVFDFKQGDIELFPSRRIEGLVDSEVLDANELRFLGCRWQEFNRLVNRTMEYQNPNLKMPVIDEEREYTTTENFELIADYLKNTPRVRGIRNICDQLGIPRFKLIGEDYIATDYLSPSLFDKP